MSSKSPRLRAAIAGLVGLGVLAGAVPAHAVLSGENGRIVLISGRAPETDATARPYLLPVPSNSTGGGTLSAPISPPGGQYRHPTWSPDRTKIAYANGTAGGVYDIFVQDIAAGTGPVPITDLADNLSADRPAWSPDGTRIAYEHQPTAGSADRHIRVQPANDLQPPFTTTDLTAAGAPFEGKPAWTPDSATVYFHMNDPADAAANSGIYRKPATGGTETLAIADTGISEAQPSISPDGTQICYTLTNAGFNSSADVLVATLAANPVSGIIISKTASPAQGDYNCTWSPDGQMVAYVNGVFGSGRLVMVRADNTSPIEIELAEAPGFDGNPDWAPDGRPECPDTTVNTLRDQPVTFTVQCTDTGPAYERTNVLEYADTQPTRGTLADTNAGDPITYTPNQGFTGTDTFQVNSFDGLGFGTDRATVTINVRAPGGNDPTPDPTPTATCRGKTATIVGTAGKDKLTGTSAADVIVGGEANDKINGGGRKDLICGGTGNDKIKGSAGKDRLRGDAGRDRLSGGSGADRLKGGAGTDRCKGGPGRDRASACERSAGVP